MTWQFCILASTISVIFGQWEGDYEGLCALKSQLGTCMNRISSRTRNLRAHDPKLGVLTTLPGSCSMPLVETA